MLQRMAITPLPPCGKACAIPSMSTKHRHARRLLALMPQNPIPATLKTRLFSPGLVAPVAGDSLLSQPPNTSQPPPQCVWPGAPGAPALEALLLQEPSTYDTWAARRANASAGLQLQLRKAQPALLAAHADALRSGACLPVGGVEFVRAAMTAAGIKPPAWNIFPGELATHLLHQPRRTTAGRALASKEPIFIKPMRRGAFRSFVLPSDRALMDRQSYTELQRLLDLPRAEPVWVAGVLRLAAEWRYYVSGGEVIGFAPITHSAPGALPAPAVEDVSAVIAAIPLRTPYAVDFGVLEGGPTTVLALRDAWGLGLMPVGPDALSDVLYLKMLWVRWSGIVASQST